VHFTLVSSKGYVCAVTSAYSGSICVTCELTESSRTRRQQEAILVKNSAVKIQMQQVTESCQHKFAAAALLKKEGKSAELIIIRKDEHGSFVE
jgi:hypothetical protein